VQYMGFRYVRLTGYPGIPDFQTLTAHFVNTAVEHVGSISFSDPNLDAVQHITMASALSNLQSVPTDCPQCVAQPDVDVELNATQMIVQLSVALTVAAIARLACRRERRGWLGDAQLAAETMIYNFDMGALYTSFVQTITDTQNQTTGALSDCVPFYGHGNMPADPAWGTA
jgi:alpha-L-rhamnosidase